MSRLVNMDRRSRLNFRKAVRLSVFHSAELNVGHSNLGGKVRVFGILDVYTAMPFAVGRRKEKRRRLELLARTSNLKKDSMRADDARGCAGRRWTLGTALDQRRLTRTAATLLDGSALQGHSLKEALG
jgi:hypothetical protein